MDNTFANDQMQTRELFDRLMKRINTAIPGVIQSFDPATQTCTVIPAIKPRVFLEGVTRDVDPIPIRHVPVVFPFAVGAGFALTLPVQAGDSCLLIFSQRCIDNWWQSGCLQPAELGGAISARHHDYNDALAIPCGGPQPDVLGGWCSDGVEIRNRSRSVRFTLREDAIEVDGPVTFKKAVTFENTVDVTGAATFDSTVGVTGAVTFDSTLGVDGAATFGAAIIDSNAIDHTTHKHGGITTGTDASGVPSA